MNNMWKSLGAHSKQISALASILGLITLLGTGVHYVWQSLKPDVQIILKSEPSTVSPCLIEWVQDASNAIKALPAHKEGEADIYQMFRKIQGRGPLCSLRKDVQLNQNELGRLRIDVINQTDRIIPGVRLRIPRNNPSWGITLIGMFLTEKETKKWQDEATAGIGQTWTLPELPPIPPKSSYSIRLYGDVDNAEVSASMPAATYEILHTVSVFKERGMREFIIIVFAALFLMLPAAYGYFFKARNRA